MTMWFKTQYPGIRYREHKDRKPNGKPDRYFVIRYKKGGKSVDESLGWASNGMNAQKANKIRSEIVQNIKEGKRPQSLKEKREMEQIERDADTQRREKAEHELFTFGELMEDHYLPWSNENKRRAQDDHSMYRNWLSPRYKKMPLKDISPLLLENLKKDMYQDGKADATVRHALCLVRQAFNKAVMWRLWEGDNPCKFVSFPKPKNEKKSFLTADEASRLLGALRARSPQLARMAILSLYGGLRFGEICGLTWSNIDFDHGIINLLDTKGEDHPIFITGPIKEVLNELPQGKPDEYVFKTKDGDQVEWLSKSFQKTVEEIGLNDGKTDPREKVTFHTLRHTYASWAVMKGIPLYTVGKAIGHTTTVMTRRYSHLAPESQRKAFEAVAEFAKDQAADAVE
jgi:integrase